MLKLFVVMLVVLFVYFIVGGTKAAPCNNRLVNSAMPSNFCPFTLASGLKNPRQIAVASNNDILVVESGLAQVTVLFDLNKDDYYDLNERATLATAPGLNHAVLINDGYLYASNPSTVFRWKYQPGNRSNLGNYEIVINNIPDCCDHSTRTLIIDSDNRLYVQQGSGANIDPDLTHSLIRRFRLPNAIPNGGIAFATGELFAFGLRNEVGLRFDNEKKLWGVENGLDNLFRQDLGGDIHINNPSEEINIFNTSTPGKFYGYPYCWSQFNLTINHGMPIGTQWGFPQFMPNITDAWCNNNNNVVKPALNMQAHYAPLDINFYYGKQWPAQYQNSAYVTCHGSWDRDPPAGYRVLHVTLSNGLPVKYEPFLEYSGNGETGNNWQRPVSLGIGTCATFGDCFFVSCDSSGIIIGIGYMGDNSKLNKI